MLSNRIKARLRFFLPDLKNKHEILNYFWSLPDRVWLQSQSGGKYDFSRREEQENDFTRSMFYLWLSPTQFRFCQDVYGTPFLTGVLDQVFRPLLESGFSAPFPIVVYLTAGYTLGRLDIPREHPSARKWQIPTIVNSYINALNVWLEEILRFEYRTRIMENEYGEVTSRPFNWLHVLQFTRRVLSHQEIGVREEYIVYDASICDSQSLRESLSEGEGTVWETAFATGTAFKKVPSPDHDLNMYFRRALEQINCRLPPEAPRGELPDQSIKTKIREQQARAVRFYLGRSAIRQGLDLVTGARYDSMLVYTYSDMVYEQLLDLRALAGYQAFGKFEPDEQTKMMLELLRRQMVDVTMIQRARESTVEGLTRRGSFSQILKWQLALKDITLPEKSRFAHVYDRYLNHHLLYLKRVSERSQEMLLTFLVVIDLSTGSFEKMAEGTRWNSAVREVFAHLLQDSYQIVWRIPKLYVDAVVVIHDGQQILWQTVLTLSEGDAQNPAADDVFLRLLPTYLSSELAFADSATFFQYLVPPLLMQPLEYAPVEAKDQKLAESILNVVMATREKRIFWMRGNRKTTGASSGGLLPSADLLITLLSSPDPGSAPDRPGEEYDIFGSLALTQHFWMLDMDRSKVRMRLSTQGGEYNSSYACSLSDFEWQNLINNSQPPASIRQAFIHEILSGLQALCIGEEGWT